MTEAVLFSELETLGGQKIGHICLNVESTLNALSLDMVRMIRPKLKRWAGDPEVVALLITANGRAFCAGGDIQALYRAIRANQAAETVVDAYPFEFFEEEYRLDYELHTFDKPVIVLGHGVVMGGGLGIFSAGSHRVLTETSRLAVPEITIGLFPDAGATWSLGLMDRHVASFLGLTGSHANAEDALIAGWGNYLMADEERTAIPTQLRELRWSDSADSNHELVSEFLEGLRKPRTKPAELSHLSEREVYVDDFEREIAATRALAGVSEWIDRGLGNLERGCPTTAGIVVEQLRRADEMSLADTFRMELTVGTHCARNQDFAEGVRALLIEKDNAPKWRFGDLDALEWPHVLSHFDAPWDVHPLADLGPQQTS